MPDIPPKEMPKRRRKSDHGRGRALGAGSEAAEGIHGVGITADPGAASALDSRVTGVSARDGAMRAGSEPLRDRSTEHTSGYGGEGGVPRTSADEREHLAPDGTLEGEE